MRTVEIGICPTGIVCLRPNQVLRVLIQSSQGLAEEEVFHPAGIWVTLVGVELHPRAILSCFWM